jgi:hypothetical protein
MAPIVYTTCAVCAIVIGTAISVSLSRFVLGVDFFRGIL